MENEKRDAENDSESCDIFKEINEIVHEVFSSISRCPARIAFLIYNKNRPLAGAVFVSHTLELSFR